MRLGCQTPKGTPLARKRKYVRGGHFPTTFIGLTYIHLNKDYCICGNAIISIHQNRHGSSEMGAWLETGGQTGTEEDYLQCIITLSSTYWNMRSNIINSFWKTYYHIISYPWTPIYRKPEKTSWHLSPRSPDLKSSTFGTSSRPKIFKASMHVECTSHFLWCLLMFNNEDLFEQSMVQQLSLKLRTSPWWFWCFDSCLAEVASDQALD